MRRLILFRHAKSSWSYTALPDFERPLNDRGRRDAPVMAKRVLPFIGKSPFLLSSPANRAAATARLAAEVWKKDQEQIHYRAKLYHAPVADLWQEIRALPDTVSTVIVFGHNEGLADLAVSCSPSELIQLPTAGVVVFDFSVDRWVDTAAREARLVHMDYPKKQLA